MWSIRISQDDISGVPSVLMYLLLNEVYFSLSMPISFFQSIWSWFLSILIGLFPRLFAKVGVSQIHHQIFLKPSHD